MFAYIRNVVKEVKRMKAKVKNILTIAAVVAVAFAPIVGRPWF